MVKIRLRRTGAKKQPSYRVVVADSRAPRDGRFIEIIGHYNPRTEPVTLEVHEDRVLHWLSVGAQPTETVQHLLENLGTLERFARLKKGEDLEALLAEARASGGQAEVSSKPRPEKKASDINRTDKTAPIAAAEAELSAEVAANPEVPSTEEA